VFPGHKEEMPLLLEEEEEIIKAEGEGVALIRERPDPKPLGNILPVVLMNSYGVTMIAMFHLLRKSKSQTVVVVLLLREANNHKDLPVVVTLTAIQEPVVAL